MDYVILLDILDEDDAAINYDYYVGTIDDKSFRFTDSELEGFDDHKMYKHVAALAILIITRSIIRAVRHLS